MDAVVAVDVDGSSHSAHQIVGMGIFPAEYSVDLHNFLLPVQRFEIMGYSQQVDLRRKSVARMPPIAVSKNPQLPAVHDFFYLVLNVLEVAG
ncbi:hypothetical protein D3C81_1706490 [compost metagenome]